MGFQSLSLCLALACLTTNAAWFGLDKISSGAKDLADKAMHDVGQGMGAVESSISPSALRSFCAQNGYTEWIGLGPEPALPSGIVGNAWSGWGKLTGKGYGLVTPEAGMTGKCEGAGWGKPGSVTVTNNNGGTNGGLSITETNGGTNGGSTGTGRQTGDETETGVANNLIHEVAQAMGVVESAVSPSALRAFCSENGYTVWIGSGPEPAAHEGIIGNAWDKWGKLTGKGYGLVTPDSGLRGKCHGAGWAAPGIDTITTVTEGGTNDEVNNDHSNGVVTITGSNGVTSGGSTETGRRTGDETETGITDNLIHDIAQAMGIVESAVSPSALRAFCSQNGYTVWIGSGPEPAEPEGLISNAWDKWGKLTGKGYGLVTPDSGLRGKCHGAGWAAPGIDAITTVTEGGTNGIVNNDQSNGAVTITGSNGFNNGLVKNIGSNGEVTVKGTNGNGVTNGGNNGGYNNDQSNGGFSITGNNGVNNNGGTNGGSTQTGRQTGDETETGVVNNLIHDVAQAMGIVESAVSPSALRSFCSQNGYTVWIGSGPEPAAPEGLVGNAWDKWGTLTGKGYGLVTPDSGLRGKCHGAGWAQPGVDTITTVTHGGTNDNDVVNHDQSNGVVTITDSNGVNSNGGTIGGSSGTGRLTGDETESGVADNLIHEVAQAMGVVESAVSPSALRAFCSENGYTVWIGSGPEPSAPEGLIRNAWDKWGKLTGKGYGLVTPDSGLRGKCHGAGWAAPGVDTITTVTHGGSNDVVNNGLSNGDVTITSSNAVTSGGSSETGRRTSDETETGVTDNLIHDVAQAMGIVESAVSPSALRAFCSQNGYTVWIGSGPEPAAPEGLISNAWDKWGKLTGKGYGLVTPDSGLRGKCRGAGWAAPGIDTITEGGTNGVVNHDQSDGVVTITGNNEISSSTDGGGSTGTGRQTGDETETGLVNNLMHDVAQGMGAVESAVSPSALRSFCAQNGYTKWIGSGPEPEGPSGLIGNAWSGWGKLTGKGYGLVTPDAGLRGKCHGAGWAAP